MVTVSDGKTQPEPVKIHLTMELLILQRMDTTTPPPVFGPPIESKASIMYANLFQICVNNFFKGTNGSNNPTRYWWSRVEY